MCETLTSCLDLCLKYFLIIFGSHLPGKYICSLKSLLPIHSVQPFLPFPACLYDYGWLWISFLKHAVFNYWSSSSSSFFPLSSCTLGILLTYILYFDLWHLDFLDAGTGNGMIKSLLDLVGEPCKASNAILAVIRGYRWRLFVFFHSKIFSPSSWV